MFSIGNLKWNKTVEMSQPVLLCMSILLAFSSSCFLVCISVVAGVASREALDLGWLMSAFLSFLSLLLFLFRAYNCWEKKWIYCHCRACCQVTRACCYLEKFNAKVLHKERNTLKHSKPSIKNSAVFWITGFLGNFKYNKRLLFLLLEYLLVFLPFKFLLLE